MSYRTLEVELDHGQVRTNKAEALPTRARALLTILDTPPPAPTPAEEGSLADRVAHLKGIGRGEYTDLSTNKRHMDDFGK